jgi:hypothetical protein
MLTLASFQLFPQTTLRESGLHMRLWYNPGFLDVDDLTVLRGNGSTGFYIPFDCSITDSIVLVEAKDIFTTLDANVQNPQSIQVSARLYSNNTPKDWVFTNWVIPSEAEYPGGVITKDQLTIYNEGANTLANPPATYLTESQTIAYFNTLTTNNNASNIVKGITYLDVAPLIPTHPTAVGSNSYATTSHLGISKPSVAPASPTIPIFVGDNDTRVPTQNENDALQGTSGSPSNTNRYVTDIDPRVMSGIFDATSFGAIGDWNGTTGTDNTVALQLWLATAQAAGGVPYLPPGKYYVNPSSGTEVLLVTRPLIFMGGGSRCTTIIVGPDVPTTCDIIRVAPAIPIGPGPVFDDTDLRGYYFRDFGISAYDGSDDSGATPRPGRHALNLDVSAAYTAIYESVIERVYFTDLDGQGVFVDANASPDGIYAFGYSVIRDSTIYNGLNLQGTVDSIRIQCNQLRGKNPGVYIYQGVGSTEAVIDNNNITAGGGIIITHAVQFNIAHNIIEMRYANTVGSDGAVISIHGPTVIGGVIERNQINTVSLSPALNGIYLESCDGVEVGSNTYQLDSSKAMVVLHGTDVTDAQLSLRQTSTSGGSPPTLFVLNGATVVYEGVAVGDAYLTPGLPGRLSYAGGARFGTGTHGHSNYYAGQATPGFGSIAAGATAEYSIAQSGVTISYNVTAMPQSDPGVAFQWSCRPTTDAVILRVANVTSGAATPASINWTWYAELANT